MALSYGESNPDNLTYSHWKLVDGDDGRKVLYDNSLWDIHTVFNARTMYDHVCNKSACYIPGG